MEKYFKILLVKFGKFVVFVTVLVGLILLLSFFTESKIEKGFKEGGAALLEAYNGTNGTGYRLSDAVDSFNRSNYITLKVVDEFGSEFSLLTFPDNFGYSGPVLPCVLFPVNYSDQNDLVFLGFLGLDGIAGESHKADSTGRYYIKKAWDILNKEDLGE